MYAAASLDFAALPKIFAGQQQPRSHLLVARARIRELLVGVDNLGYGKMVLLTDASARLLRRMVYYTALRSRYEHFLWIKRQQN